MRLVLALLSLALCSGASAKDAFTITDAIKQAVRTHPAVGEAAANRRATDAELNQSKGVLLPQVRLEVRAGPEKLYRAITPAPAENGEWKNGRDGSIVIRQLVFDGFSSINNIWMQAARLDAATSRVHERSELTALDATEAYIDVTRYTRIVALATDNLTAHRRLLSNVRARFSGGRAGEGDLQQAIEREQSAEATLADYRQRLSDARAAFRKAVGIEPYNVVFPSRLGGLPRSKDESLAIALKFNPTIRAAGFDAQAAKHGFKATAGTFVPNVYLEGRALRGNDSITYDGRRDEVSGKVIVSWDIFNGGQDSWRRAGAAERMTEQSMRHARLQRDAFETLDKAWAARTITTERVGALGRELAAARKVVVAYTKEYEIGQRTLVDLLNAENQQFASATSLVSAQGVAVFADYQLLAVMGQLLNYLKTPHPPEAILSANPAGVLPLKIAPVIINTPDVGPAPLRTMGPGQASAANIRAAATSGGAQFAERFHYPAGEPQAAPSAIAAEIELLSDKRMSFVAPTLTTGPADSGLLLKMPLWPVKTANGQ